VAGLSSSSDGQEIFASAVGIEVPALIFYLSTFCTGGLFHSNAITATTVPETPMN
jgi:hypothetical protein